MDTIKETALLLWCTPVYLILILAEIVLSNIQKQSSYTVKGTIENVYLSSINALLDLMMRGVNLIVLDFFFENRLIEISNSIMYWVALVIGLDFLFFVLHVVDHKCRLFWAIHVTHHSSEEFNLTVGFRSSVFQPIYRFIYFIPLAVLGFTPIDILFVYAASQIYGILLHTKWVDGFGLLNWILVTPSYHRVHHGSNPEYIDKNLGMVLIVWDRIFGTFKEEQAPVQFGISKKLKDHHPLIVVFHEWVDLVNDLKKANSLKDRMKILLRPPGATPPDNQTH